MRRNIVKLPVRRQTVGAILVFSALGASCSRALFVPPAGPGDPAPDAPAAWAEATATCRDVRAYSALVTLSGNVGGRGFPGITVNTAVTAEGAAHLLAHYSGTQIFLLAGREDRAWLWLREENRVASGSIEDVVSSLADVRLGGADLFAILTGCAVRDFDMANGRRYGELVGVDTAGGRVFLEQIDAVWAVRAALLDGVGVTVEYRRRDAGLPSEVIVGTRSASSPVRLRFRAEQMALNEDLAPQLFTLPAGAASAAPMTLEELRTSGPLRSR
jgi:hypothetical protein